jgi:hypothetical protein
MPLPIFGEDSFLPFEFPIFQGVSALIGSILQTSPLVATRISALIFFQISAVFIFLIARRFYENRVALITLLLFELTPFGLRFAHSPLIEFTAVSLMLVAIYMFIKYFEEVKLGFKVGFFIVATIALVLAFLGKVTTGVALSPLLLLPLFANSSQKVPKKVLFFKVLPIAVSLGLSVYVVSKWISYSDRIKELNPFTAHLISTLPHMKAWTIGNLQDRFDVVAWETILLKYLGPICGSVLILDFLTLFACVNQKKSTTFLLIFTIFFPMLAFINLYKNHQYYVAAVFPILVLVCALGLNGFANFFAPVKSKLLVSSLVVFFLLTSFSSRYGLNYFADIFHHASPPALVSEINRVVPANNYIMYLGCDWNLEIPYYIDSKILMVPEWGIRPNQSDLDQVNHVVFCDLFPQNQNSAIEKYFPRAEGIEKLSPNVVKVR